MLRSQVIVFVRLRQTHCWRCCDGLRRHIRARCWVSSGSDRVVAESHWICVRGRSIVWAAFGVAAAEGSANHQEDSGQYNKNVAARVQTAVGRNDHPNREKSAHTISKHDGRAVKGDEI